MTTTLRPLTLILALSLLPAEATGEQAQTLTLDGIVERALEQDLSLKIQRNGVETAREDLRESKTLRRPDLSFQGQTRYFDEVQALGTVSGVLPIERDSLIYTAGLNLDTRLPQWKRNSLLIRNSTDKLAMAELDAKAAEINTISSAVKHYYSVLLNKRFLSSVEEARKAATLHLEETRKFFSSGRATHSDLLNARVNLTNISTDEINRKKSLAAALEDLEQFLNLPAGTAFQVLGELAFEPVKLDRASAIERVLGGNLELRRMLRSRGVRERDISIEKHRDWPTVSLIGAYNYQDFELISDRDSYQVGMTMNVPLFRRGMRKDDVKRAERGLWRIEQEISQRQQSLRLQAKRILEDLAYDLLIIGNQKSTIDLAKENVAITEENYRRGKSDSLEVANALQTLTRAETEYYQAIYNYLTTVVRLAGLAGEDPRRMLAEVDR